MTHKIGSSVCREFISITKLEVEINTQYYKKSSLI